jgi:protein SCO1
VTSPRPGALRVAVGVMAAMAGFAPVTQAADPWPAACPAGNARGLISRPGAGIPDLEVLDQDGRRRRFYSDLVEGKVVVLSFGFTTCRGYCPMQGRALAALQAALSDQEGVRFVTVSLDPSNDTPARLKAWGERYGRGPAWTLVTGEKAAIDCLLLRLRGAASGTAEHEPILLIGNDRRAIWVREHALEAPERLRQTVARLRD